MLLLFALPALFSTFAQARHLTTPSPLSSQTVESQAPSPATSISSSIITPPPSANRVIWDESSSSGSTTSIYCDNILCSNGRIWCWYWAGFTGYDVSRGPLPGEAVTKLGPCTDGHFVQDGESTMVEYEVRGYDVEGENDEDGW